MGLAMGFSDSSPCVAPNPDPAKFRIIKVTQNGKYFLSTIVYEGCTSFEGKKVLLTKFDPRKRSVIDPHFRPGSGMIARFEPTARGIKLGLQLLNRME